MARFTIKLSEVERAALVKLAEDEQRDPRVQATLLVRESLERRGLLPVKTPNAIATKCNAVQRARGMDDAAP